MTRTITAAVASFGLVISTAIASIIVVGLLEGIAAVPDFIPPAAAILVFLAGLGLAGRVAVDVDPAHALRAVACTATVVAIGGIIAAQATESQGEALEPLTVVTLGVGLFVLLAASVLATHHRRRRVQKSSAPKVDSTNVTMT